MANSLHVVLSVYMIWYSTSVQGRNISILEHPSSLLATVNEIGEFSCKAHCTQRCSGHWKINGENTRNDLSMWKKIGFTFPEIYSRWNSTEYILSLGVNASEANNNSMIECVFTSIERGDSWISISNQSRIAQLVVISNNIELPSSAINTSVLFKGDRMPVLLEVYMQIPSVLCNVLEVVHYSLIVESMQNNLVKHFGPFSNLSSCLEKRLINPNLKGNEMYTLMVIIETQSQNITSCKHSFNTTFIDNRDDSEVCDFKQGASSQFSYQLIVIISLSMAVLLLFSALIIVLLCVCINCRRKARERRLKHAKNELCKTMVHNPLYERTGPDYEIVPPRQGTSTPNTAQSMNVLTPTLPTNQHYDTIHTPAYSSQQDAITVDTAHYVDPFVHKPQFQSASFASSAHMHPSVPDRETAYDKFVPRSTSCSLPGPGSGLMGLKKNGQERNKLHLTLSLGKDDVTSLPGHVKSDANDNYTVLNPIHSRRNVGCNDLRVTKLENSLTYNV